MDAGASGTSLDGSLDRGGPTPIFQQIRSQLEGAIASGELQPDQRIPSERELSARFGVSRMTVRQALDAMTHDGRLYSLTGKGTFVASRRVFEQPLQHLTSFTQDMERRGMRPSSRTLDAGTMPASLELARLLDIEPHAEVVRVRRLRLANEEPLAIETVHLPSRLVPGILERDLANGSLYQHLEREHGIRPARARQTIEAGEPDAEEIGLLGLDRPHPVLRITRLSADITGRVIEYVRSVYRGDRYQLTVELG